MILQVRLHLFLPGWLSSSLGPPVLLVLPSYVPVQEVSHGTSSLFRTAGNNSTDFD